MVVCAQATAGRGDESCRPKGRCERRSGPLTAICSGGALANGYPAAKHQEKTVSLKRLLWEQMHGPVPDDLAWSPVCVECGSA